MSREQVKESALRSGELEEIDWIDVRWPSARRQRLEKPPVDTTIRIVEGVDGFEEVYGR